MYFTISAEKRGRERKRAEKSGKSMCKAPTAAWFGSVPRGHALPAPHRQRSESVGERDAARPQRDFATQRDRRRDIDGDRAASWTTRRRSRNRFSSESKGQSRSAEEARRSHRAAGGAMDGSVGERRAGAPERRSSGRERRSSSRDPDGSDGRRGGQPRR